MFILELMLQMFTLSSAPLALVVAGAPHEAHSISQLVQVLQGSCKLSLAMTRLLDILRMVFLHQYAE